MNISNNAIINNNCWKLQDIILIFKISRGIRKKFLEFIDILGMRPHQGSLGLS